MSMVPNMQAHNTPFVIHLICASGFYGSERVVANIMQAFDGFNMKVLCLAPETADLHLFEKLVCTKRKDGFIRSPNTVTAGIKQLRKLKDLHGHFTIHAHGYKEVFIAQLFRFFSQHNIIVTQHGFITRHPKHKIYNWINKICCRSNHVQGVIAVNRDIAKIYERFGVAPQKITVLNNGLIPSNATQTFRAKVEVIHRLQKPTDRKLVLYCGRLSAEKDPLLFVRTVARIHAVKPNIIGIIAGDGPLSTQVKLEIQRLHLQKHIICLGYVVDTHELMHLADLVVLTSQTEGLPMTLLEAMSVGTPVVAAKVGGVEELIQSDYNGYLINSRQATKFAEACLTVLNDTRTQSRLAHAAINTITQRFNILQQKSTYAKLYGFGADQC